MTLPASMKGYDALGAAGEIADDPPPLPPKKVPKLTACSQELQKLNHEYFDVQNQYLHLQEVLTKLQAPQDPMNPQPGVHVELILAIDGMQLDVPQPTQAELIQYATNALGQLGGRVLELVDQQYAVIVEAKAHADQLRVGAGQR
jgi:hypothetical protein